MSYLNLPSINLADFSKGTISLWFRFSQDSIDNAIAHRGRYQPPDFGDGALGPSIFAYSIPLVTFGRKVMAHTYGSVPHGWPFPTGGIGATTFDSVQKADSPAEPSHLGITLDAANQPVLEMVFQTNTRAQVQGLVTQATNVYWELNTSGSAYERYDVIRDISYIRTSMPEQFWIVPKFQISIDVWHHLLVSFDFSTSVDVVALANYKGDNVERDAIKSACKFWYAFDDENKDGKDNMGDSWAFHGPNDVVPITAVRAAFGFVPQSPPLNSTGKPAVTGELFNAEYHWVASKIPINGGPVGLPASAEYVDTIYHVEMGEFQFFADFVIDTSDINKRRAFVDASGRPVDPADTEKMLGRKPDILLHGTGNWQEGSNTGSTGIMKNDKGEDIVNKAGQFQHIGLIEKYTPDPKLGEG
jgi:hypothetical protein